MQGEGEVSNDQVNEIVNRITRDYALALSAADPAAELGMSDSRFSRFFRRARWGFPRLDLDTPPGLEPLASPWRRYEQRAEWLPLEYNRRRTDLTRTAKVLD